MRTLALSLAAGTALALAPALLPAQAATGMNSLGVYGGWSRTDLHGPEIPGPLHTNGGLGGAYVQWRINNHFDIQPEVQYVQKGNRELDSYWGGNFALRIRLSYVEIPVLVRARGSTYAGRFTPYLLAGPEVAFKTGCSLDVFDLPGNYTCSDLPASKSVDYGIIGGGGVDVGLGGRQFTVSVRYDQGLADAFTSGDPKNRALTVIVGVPLWSRSEP